MPRKVGYARASITDPDVAAQEKALMAAGCHRVFVEKPTELLLYVRALSMLPPYLAS
jgi:hypothetical protein